MAQATTNIPKPKQLRLLRNKPKDRVEAEVLLATLTRHLARREIKAEWRRMGRQITPVDAVQLANAVTAHLVQHRARLRTEAKLILSSTEEKL
jgi:hypothetical protein